ncbi:hypothetical protein [Desulfosarcina sp. BuS5]|uniref:hypothetical protein n=1 Tax=Desulfosarcina sp. BuS5 TaxID=933262 RepID=UPI0004817DBF|nr:hypothetical protein [Desulfosarcina sp. BuS5]
MFGSGLSGLGDAIIAATALIHNLKLATANIKNFKWIENLGIINPLEKETGFCGYNGAKADFTRNLTQGVPQWKTKVNQNGKIQSGHPPPPIHSLERI